MFERPRTLRCATWHEEMKQWSDWKYHGVMTWLDVQDEGYQIAMHSLGAQRSQPVAVTDMGTKTNAGRICCSASWRRRMGALGGSPGRVFTCLPTS